MLSSGTLITVKIAQKLRQSQTQLFHVLTFFSLFPWVRTSSSSQPTPNHIRLSGNVHSYMHTHYSGLTSKLVHYCQEPPDLHTCITSHVYDAQCAGSTRIPKTLTATTTLAFLLIMLLDSRLPRQYQNVAHKPRIYGGAKTLRHSLVCYRSCCTKA